MIFERLLLINLQSGFLLFSKNFTEKRENDEDEIQLASVFSTMYHSFEDSSTHNSQSIIFEEVIYICE
jgi:hypothetical protein